ncbi:hypothetical protein [Haloarchaeobius sp. HRN-SO-5]|uniref:hypothetical protein n=1 Tax=Haloarchaeobius sp. HRN-SO-5 TaxID=3446118 RepID=UPI003EB9C398
MYKRKTSSTQAVLAVFLLVVASTGGTVTALTGTDASSTSLQTGQLDIEMSGGSTTMDQPHISAPPVFYANQTVTFANGTNYRLVLTNEDTGESATLRVDGNVTVDPETAGGRVTVRTHDPYGTALSEPALRPWGGDSVPVTVTNGSISSATGLTNYSVALHNASTGDVVAQAAPRSYVLGYTGLLSADGTSGVVDLSLPRDVLPTEANATVTVYNASQDYWRDNTTKVEKPITYDASADAFTTTLDTTQLPDGVYNWRVDFDLPGNGTFQQSSEYGSGVSPFEFQNDGNDTTSSNATVALESSTLPLDSTTTLDLTLSDAPEGVSGYEITIKRSNRSVLDITNATFPEGWALTDTSYDSATGLTVKAADLNGTVEPGATNVSLATFEVRGAADGETNISVTVEALDDDSGDVIAADTVDSHVEVDAVVQVCDGCGTPTDPDGDGDYEDVNGNGRLDFDDVVVLSNNLDATTITDYTNAFDFNSNGQIDPDDVTTLFDER